MPQKGFNMPARKTPEQRLNPSLQEEALSIINTYRNEFKDQTSLSSSDMEFPYLDIENREAVSILETGDNEAGAFKWRGALVGAIALQRLGYDRLVVPSAGNHARGAILAARALDMSVDVVVPDSAPRAKREGLSELWDSPHNRVHVAGSAFDDSLRFAKGFVKARGGALLHPYDDMHVIAGQGTIVDDILKLQEDVDQIVLPVGGGGLLAGVTNRLRVLNREDVRVTAVEAPGSDSLSRSLRRRKVVSAEAPNPEYGGLAVRYVGRRALQGAMRYPNLEVITADQEDISHVISTYVQSRNDLMRTERYFVPAYEPTSLVAVAGLYGAARRHENMVIIGTGHNEPIK